MSDLVLVVPPCASAALPILGPSLLAAGCRAAGFDVHVDYANLELAARVGYGRYRRFALSCTRMHGEMLFAREAWGRDLALRPDDFDDRPDTVSAADFAAAREQVPSFVADVADAIAARRPRVVGFSSVFQQNIASVALARAVRERLPDAMLLLGGANAAQPMAAGIADPRAAGGVFDLVVAGEADTELPRLLRRLLDGDVPAGPVYDCPPLERLDAVPTPVFDDYFEQVAPLVAAGRLPDGLPIALPFESSRGCAWGERHHCTFCGLNGAQIAERAKSPTRVLDEIEELAARHGVTDLRASDDLLPRRVQKEVLPELARRQAARPAPLTFFYEVRAALKRPQLELLADAGVTQVQCGIESLSSATLRAIDKGTTGVRNLAFLRDCRAVGVDPLWNWMVGFPGDEREDYEATLRLLPFIEHIRPPIALAPVRVDRFSPYHREPGRYGIEQLAPLPGMERVWPDGAAINEIAYHFTGRMASPFRDDPVLARRVGAAVDGWNERWAQEGGAPALQWVGNDQVLDSRRVAVQRQTSLSAAASALLNHLERPRPAEQVEASADDAALSELLYRGFVIQHEGSLMSVVVRPR